MFLVLAFVAAVACGWARGGRLARLLTLPLQWMGVALAAFALQVYVVYFTEPHASLLSLRAMVVVASYLLLIAFVVRNRRIPGMWLLGAGLLANFAVIAANGGFMPVTHEALSAAGLGWMATQATGGTVLLASKDILLPIAETRLWFLSDLLVVPPPLPLANVYSIGDALIAAGLFWLIQSAMTQTTDKNPTLKAEIPARQLPEESV